MSKQIGRALKRKRIARKATQAQVAAALGTSQEFLSMIEEGKRDPSNAMIEKINDWISSGGVAGRAKRGAYRT